MSRGQVDQAQATPDKTFSFTAGSGPSGALTSRMITCILLWPRAIHTVVPFIVEVVVQHALRSGLFNYWSPECERTPSQNSWIRRQFPRRIHTRAAEYLT